MIHVFNYKNAYYIYDTGSGSLHSCDKETADYLKARYLKQDTDISYLPPEKIAEIEGDISSLKESGLLF